VKGIQFFKHLKRQGIPSSAIAMKTKKDLKTVYNLKTTDKVPDIFLKAAGVMEETKK